VTDESLHIFATEAEDLLGLAEQALLNLDDLDNEPDTLDGINDLFRTFHTIKGAAGLFGLDAIVDFTHIVENVLGAIRASSLTLDEDMVSLFLLSRDHLENLVENALEGTGGIDGELKQKDDELVERLNNYLSASSGGHSSDDDSTEVSQSTKTDNNTPENVINENWHISLRFGPNALRNGMDPASFIRYLAKLGGINSLTLIEDAIPQWSDYDPESLYLGFEIVLYAPDTTKEIIEEVFEFVQDDCAISILPPNSHIDAYIKMIDELPEEDMRIGDILVACGALTLREMEDVLNVQDHMVDDITASDVAQQVTPLGEVAIENHVVERQVVDAALKKQTDIRQQRTNAEQTVRVNALKLESLVNLVGELVIGSANSELNARRLADPDLNEAMENLSRLVEEVRDTTLGLRMVQIGETFNRYKRVVREVSRDTGKQIELRISGSETELDKTLIEKITDPLMHLVRNAIDHGIESPETRVAAGKPAMGVVNLDASHDSGSIVIKISDDGGGLSREKIINKALEKGLIQEDQPLTDQEVYRLIFEAGFSTAATVTDISGRGVGMDVVRRNIESLRGQVEIDSEEGKGSIISIRLPLTLAIIDGFQVRVGNARYIVPLDMVDECMELSASLRGNDENSNYLNLRGEILPYVYLRELFGNKQGLDEERRNNIVVVQFAGKKVGIVVDELMGENQTVIKPLGKVFQNLRGISGATILGSGEVAMIIDIPEMIKRVEHSGQQQQLTAHTIQ
jgi:two-component system, chemotaxis family, sensor kinase CheA